MKNIKTKLNKFALSVLLMVLGFSIVSTGLFAFATPASAMTCNSATITGTVITGTPPARARFEYGTNQSTVANGGGITTTVQTFSTEGSFPMEQYISGLSEKTTYYFRIVVTNNYGTEAGAVRSFTTPACTVTPQTCQDTSATNYGGALPCRYPVQTCTDRSATNYGGTLPCQYAPRTCTDRSATNYGGALPCQYRAQVCTDYNATNYGGALPCRYPVQTCTDSNATNYGGALPCQYRAQVCTDYNATNYGGALPCRYNTIRPTVDIRADDTNIDRDGDTVIRWSSTNADSCRATGGDNGWYGSKSTSGTFRTGSISGNTMYGITCTNTNGSDDDSVTIYVNNNNNRAPTVSIYASPSSVVYNGASNITWNSSNADSCRATNGTNSWSGSRNTSGTFYTGAMTNTTTFSINCSNSYSSVNDSVTVYVGNPTVVVETIPRPTISISADITSLPYNGATTVRWTASNATSCNATGGSVGWEGAKSVGSGSFYTGSLASTKTYSITCSNSAGSAADFVTVNVRGQVVNTTTTTTVAKPVQSSYILVTSSVDRNQPIIPTLDNTNPCPGDEINYSIMYQNIGNASVTGLVLRLDLPREVNYISSTPNNPIVSGNTLVFNLGTLRANSKGTISVRVLLGNNANPGSNLNFPATLSYIDNTGQYQSVNANVSANVCNTNTALIATPTDDKTTTLGALAFGAGFLPTTMAEWLFLIILVLVLIVLAKYLFRAPARAPAYQQTAHDAPVHH